jgi:flavodoxin
MKMLVAYTTQTGNTRKVAEAIYGALEGDKELKPLKQVRALQGYDVAFLGFPVHGGAPDSRTKAFMASQAAGGKIAIFLTHGAPTGHRLA